MQDILFTSKVEFLQLFLAVVGTGFSFLRLWIAIENGLAITNTGSYDLRRIVAETQIIGELFRLFTMGCLLAIGVIGVLLPTPSLGVAPDAMLQEILVLMGLITLTFAMVLDSLVQEYRRRKFFADVKISNPDLVVVADAKPNGATPKRKNGNQEKNSEA